MPLKLYMDMSCSEKSYGLFPKYFHNIYVYFILTMSLERFYSVNWQMEDHEWRSYTIKI